LIGYQVKPDDYYAAYEQLREFDTFLADTSISLVPGEEMATGRPSMSSDFLLRNIEISPQKTVEDIYAKKFLQYKGIVEVEYSVNYILSKSLSQLIRDKHGNQLFHYMIDFKKLTVNQYDDFYYTNIEVYGSLTDDSGKTVYQFEKTFNLKLNHQQFQTIQGSSFAIADQFPVIPGNYKLSILLKNTNSHEFTAYETSVSAPEDSGELYLSPALLAYDVKGRGLPSPRKNPFSTAKGHLLVEPENKFSRTDQMNVFFQLFGASAGLRNGGKIKIEIRGEKNFSRDISRNLSEFAGNETDFLLEIPLKDFPSDYYSLTLSIIDEKGAALASREQRFLITPLATVARPQTVSKSFSLDNQAITAFILGSQYMNAGKPSRALPLLKKANNLNPQVMQFALGLARIYLDLNDYDKIKPLLMPFVNDEKPDFQLYFLLGTVNQKTGNYSDAVNYYRRLITYHGLNVDVLNALASCHYNLGEIKEARRAWEESLKVEPAQEKVKKALRGLKNEYPTSKQEK
jgi:tetratricopeptide (TPR) repeat protein